MEKHVCLDCGKDNYSAASPEDSLYGCNHCGSHKAIASSIKLEPSPARDCIILHPSAPGAKVRPLTRLRGTL